MTKKVFKGYVPRECDSDNFFEYDKGYGYIFKFLMTKTRVKSYHKEVYPLKRCTVTVEVE